MTRRMFIWGRKACKSCAAGWHCHARGSNCGLLRLITMKD